MSSWKAWTVLGDYSERFEWLIGYYACNGHVSDRKFTSWQIRSCGCRVTYFLLNCTAPDFYLKYFHKSNTALCCITSGGAAQEGGGGGKIQINQSMDGCSFFASFWKKIMRERRQQFIALAGQSNGKLESFVSLQLCKYWCYRQHFSVARFGGVCPVSHSCCRRYLQLIFWNYTSLITPPALYSFPALS